MLGVQTVPKITAQEAAKLTGYTEHNLRKLARTKRIAAERFGRMWMFNESDVLAYAERMRALGPAKHTPHRYREETTAEATDER